MAVGEKVLREAQKRYLEAIRVKSEKLVELDDWYRKDLHTFLQDRNNDDKQGAFLTSDELVKLMKWKLTVRLLSPPPSSPHPSFSPVHLFAFVQLLLYLALKNSDTRIHVLFTFFFLFIYTHSVESSDQDWSN